LILRSNIGIDWGSMPTMKLKIYGVVQGVFFRAHTRKMALDLTLAGFVRNTPDGCVEVCATGSRENLKSLQDWCQKGPPSARVDKVETCWDDADTNHHGFEIVR